LGSKHSALVLIDQEKEEYVMSSGKAVAQDLFHSVYKRDNDVYLLPSEGYGEF